MQPLRLHAGPAALAGLLLLAGCAPPAAVVSPGAAPAGDPITAEDLADKVRVLAHDSLRGREVGTSGEVSAARFVAAHAQRLGLRPAGDSGTFFQSVPLRRRKTVADLRLQTAASTRELAPTEAIPVSGLGGLPATSRTSGEGSIVYAGHLVDPEIGADELQLADLKDRVVVVQLAPPPGVDPQQGPRPAVAALFSPMSPAAAVLLIPDPSSPDFWEFASEISAKGAVELHRGSAAAGAGPPVFLISADLAERLLGQPLGAARKPRRDLGTLSYRLQENVETIRGLNVAAVLPGRDSLRAREYVSIGAHLDHVGVGAAVNGDSIYNGADDNASGSAAVLEVAEHLATLPAGQRPARSVLFLWHAAEEHGLLGSDYFTANPTVPRERIVAHVNMDMVGRNNADSLYVVGARRLSTTLGDRVDAVNARQSRPFVFDFRYDRPNDPENLYCRSDHYNFARYGIPVVFFTTGLHPDYHKPSDHADLLDYEKLARISRLVSDLTRDLADLPARPAVDKPAPPPGAPCT